MNHHVREELTEGRRSRDRSSERWAFAALLKGTYKYVKDLLQRVLPVCYTAQQIVLKVIS